MAHRHIIGYSVPQMVDSKRTSTLRVVLTKVNLQHLNQTCTSKYEDNITQNKH